MSRDYTPRRCSKRWLDGDCPPEVLCIIDTGEGPERFDVFYAEVSEFHPYEGSSYVERWMNGFCLGEGGSGYHIEMLAHQVADYRYRMKNKYAKWSTLPEAVKAAVRRDLALAAEDIAKAEAESAKAGKAG